MNNILTLSNLNLYKNQNLKIGILGGSFDPAHIGHLHIAENALEKLGIDEIWLAVTKQNPTKPTHKYNYSQRVEFASKLTTHNKKIKTLSIEDELNIILTIDLLIYLTTNFLHLEFYFIIGADLATSIHTWDKFEEIIKFAKLVIFSRAGYTHLISSSKVIEQYGNTDKVIFIKIEEIDISSTEIRNKENN